MKQKTIVYVLNKKGKPLMPTTRCGHVRKLLKDKKAVVVNNEPFTIRLKYETPDIVQYLCDGVDTGRENIGEGVSDEDGNCVFLCHTETHNKSIKKKMTERAEHRHSRRRHARQKKQRKALATNNAIKNGNNAVQCHKKNCKSVNTTYPGAEESVEQKVVRGYEAQFNNRTRHDGWLTPSGNQLVQITMNCIKKTMEILPISEIKLERVCFDFQKLANENIRAWEYGKGPLYGFKTYKDYIDAEQEGKCLLCGKPIHHYHHIIPKSKGGSDTVDNIAGLCDECHNGIGGVHKDETVTDQLLQAKSGCMKQYKVSLLNSVMPKLIEELTAFCNNEGIQFSITDGKTTHDIRNALGLPKNHDIDGYCISLANRDVVPSFVTKVTYKRRRFKKKSNNNINALNTRVYKHNGKIVAKNRHKAMEQKEPSLEEYMSQYAEMHSPKECNRHFHQLEICPAKRTYTFHKNNKVAPAHPGDKIKYQKTNKINGKTKNSIFICTSIDVSQNKICNNEGNRKFKYCKVIEAGCIPYVDTKQFML